MTRFAPSQTNKRFMCIFLVFAILLSILFMPMYIISYDSNRRSTVEQVKGTLQSGIKLIEAAGRAIANTYAGTVSDANFRSLLYVKDQTDLSPITLISLSNLLNMPFASFSVVRDVGIVYSEQIAVTRFRGFLTRAFSLYPTFLSCEDMSFAEWYAWLAGNAAAGIWHPAKSITSTDYGEYTGLTFAYKWQQTRLSSDMPVVFYATLDCSTLETLLVEPSILEDGYIRIMDGQGNTLYASGNSSYGDNGLTNIRNVANAAGFTVDIGISDRYIHGEIRSLFILYAVQLLLLAVGSGMLILLFSQRSSRPMLSILRFLSNEGLITPAQDVSQSSQGRIASLSSDYVLVSSSIRSLDQKLKTSIGIINEQSKYLRAYLFAKALSGSLYLDDEMTQFEKLFPDFPQTYRLIRVRTNSNDFPRDIDPFPAAVQAAAQEGFIPYHTHYVGFKSMLWLVDETAVDVSVLNRINDKVLQSGGPSYNFLVTQVCSQINYLSTAYQQLQCYGDVSGANVAVMDDSTISIDHHQMPINYPMLYDIYTALSAGNNEKACTILNGIVSNLLSGLYSISVFLHMYTMLYTMLNQLKMEYPEKLSEIAIPVFDDQQADTLFRVNIPECFGKISLVMRERMNAEDDKDKVMRFIHENLFSPDLCLTLICEKLKMHKSYIQDAVKVVTGTTCYSYIEKMRMERACTMLKEGIAVQEVAAACGFSSANSFYKAFRRVFNKAPSDF